MTKKHLIALAEIVRSNKPCEIINSMLDVETERAKEDVWENFKDDLANFCASQNPNFDRQRWLDYIDGKCGPSGGKI